LFEAGILTLAIYDFRLGDVRYLLRKS